MTVKRLVYCCKLDERGEDDDAPVCSTTSKEKTSHKSAGRSWVPCPGDVSVVKLDACCLHHGVRGTANAYGGGEFLRRMRL